MEMHFSRETIKAIKYWHNIFQVPKKRTINPQLYVHQKYPAVMKQISRQSKEEKLRQFVARDILQSINKKILWTERK